MRSILSYAAAQSGKTWESTGSVLASRSKWLVNLHRLQSIGDQVMAWHSRACSPGLSEWQDMCAEMEWQCSHLSEHRVDVKPVGLGNAVCLLKISEAR